MKFYPDYKDKPDYMLWFFKRLERLAACLLITAKDINARIERYGRVLTEMDNRLDHNLADPLRTIELSEQEKREFLEALDGEVYRLTPRRRNYTILRLGTTA